MHILLLGGTTEAGGLAQLLAAHPAMRVTLSLAGRTQHPVLPPVPHRIGGFGGASGLAQWMRDHQVTALVDATHPFASVMPYNAAKAAQATHTPILALRRPPWQPVSGDNWLQVDSHADAIAALGKTEKRIFLTVGRLELGAYAAAPQHFYAVRTIDPLQSKPLPNAVWITGRGPFSVAGETALITSHQLGMVITKNSGGHATRAKLDAARALGIPVILLRRPPKPPVEETATAEQAMRWIAKTHGVSL
jgi:precorrin-6A/cobalt-precorrin-6A reductase